MKKIIKSLFLSAVSLTMLAGCSGESTGTEDNEANQQESDFDILRRNQHTPSEKIDVQLDANTHKCVKVEVACGTHADCWPYRCVDPDQFVDDIEIISEATSSINGRGVNHVTFNSLEIGRTYKKDVNFTIPATGKAKLTTESEAREVSIETEVIQNYLECNDLKSQYEYLKATDKGEGHPAQDHQDYTIAWKGVPNREEYKVHISEEPDFSSYISEDVIGTSFTYGFYVPGKTYYVRVIGDDFENPVFSDCFKIKDNEVRYVNVEGAQNMRDLGGWKTFDGQSVNYELLYRGANLNGSVLISDTGTEVPNGCGSGKLTAKGKEQMQEMGFKTEIDLRTPLSEDAYNTMKKNGTSKPSGEGDDGGQWMFGAGWNNDLDCLLQSDMNGLMYEHLFDSSFMNYYKGIIQKVFDKLAKKESYPVYFHCNAGADRTGTYGFLLNGLLGVQYEDLTKDYQLTSYSNGGGRRWRNKGNGERFYHISEIDESIGALKPGWQFDSYNTWDLLVRRLLERYGCEDYIAKLGTSEEGNILQVCIEKWLLEEGVTEQQIAAFKDIMLNEDQYEEIKDQEFTVKVNNVPNVSKITVHGGDTLPTVNFERPGYVLSGFKDESGSEYNMYHRISKNMELTASYKALCDDAGQESMEIYTWTTKKAKELIKNNPDYQYDGCSAAFAEGVAQFMPRNENCMDTSVEMPLIKYADYPYVSFFATSAWVTASIYIDDFYLGKVTGASVAAAKKFNISISGGNVYVDGNYAYRLTSEQNNGLKGIKLRYVMDTYSKSADLCVSPFSTRIVDYVYMAKSYAESLDNVVLGGFNNLKSLAKLVNGFKKYYALCNEFERNLVNASEQVIHIAYSLGESINTVTYRIWGEISSTDELFKEDILRRPSTDPKHEPYEFAYWGTEDGEFNGFNTTVDNDITLDAYYEYESSIDGQKKYATQIYSVSYYCFGDLNSIFGSNENTVAPSDPVLPDGYTFRFWTANTETMEEFAFGSTLSDDITLYAVALDSSTGQEMIFKNIYHVTFKDGNGTGNDLVVNVFEEEFVDQIEAPEKGDNEFAFWGYNEKAFDFQTPITSDVTLYPYYWQESSSITKNSYIVWNIDKHVDDFGKANPTDETGWVPNTGNGQYIAVVTGGFVEFGLREPGKEVYTLNIPAFNFGEYECVTFDIKNTYTNVSFKINGVEVPGGIFGQGKSFKVVIKNNTLSVITQSDEIVLISQLDAQIVNGQACLVLEATDSTKGTGGGSFDIYNFYAYRNAVII